MGGLAVTAFCWGSMVPLTSLLLASLPPFLLAATRYSVAVPVLALLIALIERGPILPRDLPWRRIFMLGGLGIAGFGTCYTFGIWYSDPITAAAILATGPVVAAAMDRLIAGRRISPRSLIAIFVTVGGGVLVAIERPVSGLSAHGGELLLVLALVCWTWYSMKVQTWLGPLGLGQMRLTMLTSGASAVSLWVVYATTAALRLQPLPMAWPSAGSLAILAYLCVGPTAIAIALWNFGTARLGITVAMMILNLSPVFAVLLGMLLGARPTPLQLCGCALAIGGVIWLQFGGRRRPKPASAA
jgi:drug/metabolite transporter (DMT)-like permease